MLALLDYILTLVKEIGLHEHDMLVYSGRDEKHQILFAYLEAGLERGERALYITGEETPQRIRDAMDEFGLDVEHLEATFSLVIRSHEGFYLFDGEPDVPLTLKLLGEVAADANAMGFRGTIGAGEMACWFDDTFIDELVEYEKALEPRIRVPLTALCAYNAEALENLSPNTLQDLFLAHAGP